MRDRIDISEVEAQTKIRAKYLRAIENEEWDLLPGPIYAKSFLRTYGDYLGLDSRMLIDEFKHRYEDPAENDARPIGSIPARERQRQRQARPRRIPSWAPVGVVIVLILAILFVVGKASQSNSPSSAKKPAAHHHRSARHPPVTAPVTPPPAPTSVTVRLVPTGTVYVCMVNGSGAKLINERTFTSGQPVPSETAPQLLLTLGNASVQMNVNGKQVPVAPSPAAIRLLITPTHVTHIPLSQAPTCP
jgi:cytoskeletal protein RodZ